MSTVEGSGQRGKVEEQPFLVVEGGLLCKGQGRVEGRAGRTQATEGEGGLVQSI